MFGHQDECSDFRKRVCCLCHWATYGNMTSSSGINLLQDCNQLISNTDFTMQPLTIGRPDCRLAIVTPRAFAFGFVGMDEDGGKQKLAPLALGVVYTQLWSL